MWPRGCDVIITWIKRSEFFIKLYKTISLLWGQVEDFSIQFLEKKKTIVPKKITYANIADKSPIAFSGRLLKQKKKKGKKIKRNLIITFWSISLQQHWWFSIRNVSPDACALDINSFCCVQLRMVCPVPPLSWPGLCRRTMLFSIGPFLRKQRVKHVCFRRSYMLKSYRQETMRIVSCYRLLIYL